MSLLLDALKKAEKAKDDAKRRAQSDADPEETVAQVRTRNELPDISNPLEHHSEDVPGGIQLAIQESTVVEPSSTTSAHQLEIEAPAPPPLPRETVPNQTSRRPKPGRAQESAPEVQAAQRATAKNVFEAKFREPNPKLPFYITMAALGLFALGTVIYFWYQLRPPPPLVNTAATPPSDEKKTDIAPPQSAAPLPATPSQAQLAPGIPGMPSQPVPAAVVAPPGAGAPSPAAAAQTPTPPSPGVNAAPRPATMAPPERSTPATRPPRQAAASETKPQADASKLSVSRAAPAVNPKLEIAWLAYNQGNLAVARSNYQDVVREEPANRDALLGMAAVEVRAGQPESAEMYYQRLLAMNPRDPHAQAGLLALRAQMTDPIQAESRVKSLLANDPEAHVLYFTLGNQYARQGRWNEAQQAYFKAFSADPDNPDFAYNLAVSLDHVRQPKLALEYYRRAISLAQQRSSNFDQSLARNRVQELAR